MTEPNDDLIVDDDIAGPNDLDEPATDELAGMQIASGVVITHATINLADGTRLPALLYRFAAGDGSGELPPVLLGLDPANMRKLRKLTGDAAAKAIVEANTGRRS